MATSGVERVLEDWATAWSSHDTEKVLSIFTDDCVYEDVTFGAINHGKKELRAFADGVFAGVPDFRVELTARRRGGRRGSFDGGGSRMRWLMLFAVGVAGLALAGCGGGGSNNASSNTTNETTTTTAAETTTGATTTTTSGSVTTPNFASGKC